MSNTFSQSSSERVISLRKRKDLIVARHVYRGEPKWVVKNIFALEYFHFNEQEYAVLQWLDGQTSLDELVVKFEEHFAPFQASCRELQSFIVSLHEKCLLENVEVGTGQHIYEIRREKRWKELKSKLTNILSYRWKGVDPERFLSVFAPSFFWLFSKWCVAASCLLIIFSWLWLAMNYAEFLERLPSFQTITARENWLLMGFSLVFTKILHELGHAVCFKRFGGECHEIGVMLLFFMPTMYCNTTDSWLLPNKWKRIAIGLAGIYVELLMLAFAIFGWWSSSDGAFHDICFNIMIIASAGAVLLNINPLMRYDGYFVLADLLEIPNLRQLAAKETEETFYNFAFGIERSIPPESLKLRFIFVSYTICAFIYRILLMATISFILAYLLKPIGLEQLGILAAFFSLIIPIVMPVYKMYRKLRDPSVRRMLKPSRKYVGLGMLAITIAIVACVPIPMQIISEFSLEASVGRPVYVEEPGLVAEIFVDIGDQVKKGDKIIRLRNDALLLEALETEAELSILTSRIRAMTESGKLGLNSASQDIEQLVVQASGIRRRYEVLQQRIARLTVVASVDGTVMRSSVKASQTMLDDQLTAWQGNPLAKENLNASFEQQLAVCVIGDPSNVEANVAISQKDIELVKIGDETRLMLNGSTGTTIVSTIESISVANAGPEELPITLAPGVLPQMNAGNGGQNQQDSGYWTQSLSDTQNNEGHSLESSIYQASVPFPGGEKYAIGSKGKARISVGSRTVWWRIHRWLKQTLEFSF